VAFDLAQLPLPIVQAPMAGGPSTVELAAAVCEAGGLGFLAAGYKTADAVADDVTALRARTSEPFGVNIFSRPPPPAQAAADAAAAAVSAYADRLAPEAGRYDARVGDGRFDDDNYAAKVQVMLDQRVPVVSFTFGAPEPDVVAALHKKGTSVWVTITEPREARSAEDAGADALVVQGTEAGGHRASFVDQADAGEYGLLVLLRLLADQTRLPLIATGGIMDGAAVAAVLCAGAAAAQLGSALMLTPEAGTSAPHRRRLVAEGSTRLTRAFSGRQARGIVNRFMEEHGDHAPSAYPQVHHLTSPIRAAARQADDPEAINLWAGQGHALAVQAPAAELIRRIADDARTALQDAALRLQRGADGDP
jgi:nitronate monooxygenase